MNTENNEDNIVIFNTPAGYNFEALFSGLSIKFKPKVDFLIHQINFFDNKGGYQVNSKNHRWFFGIKGTELAMMLRRLVDSGIIKLVTNYNPGNRSNTYRMVNAFNSASQSTQKNFYYAQQILFVEKWIQDGYIVKNEVTSTFKKERKMTNAALIAEQQKQITDLQAKLTSLGQLKSTPQSEVSGVNYCNPVQLSIGSLLVTAKAENLVKVPLQATVASFDGLVEESQKVQPLVPETIAEADIFEVNGKEIAELALMFGDEPITSPDTRVIDLPSLEVLSTEASLQAIVDQPIEQISAERNTLATNGIADKETFLNGTLTVHYLPDGVVIENGDKLGLLKNFEGIKPWCEPMPAFEKQRLYDYLMTSTGRDVSFPLNLHTKALFTRELVDGDLLFTYMTLSAA